MTTTMAVGTEGKDNNQLKSAVEEMVATGDGDGGRW